MKPLVILLYLGVILMPAARATEQANDTLVLGGNTYGIFQVPMSGYWHLEGEEPAGRAPLPPFEFTSTANWRGHIARWSISRDKLYLTALEGRIDGKDVRNREILDKPFPVHARWYTGKLFIAVGDLNARRNAFEYVIEFGIERGDVVDTEFHQDLRIPMTWNGLAAEGGTEERRGAEGGDDSRRPSPAIHE